MLLGPIRAAFCAATALALSLAWVTPCYAQLRPQSTLRYDPRVIRYDFERDEVYVAYSSVTRAPGYLPGGDVAYIGNRLDDFRYTGPPGTGGIYDALGESYRRRKLDPKKYRHRIHYPSAFESW
ncbi:MAG: hypothetical protein K1X74_15220 [Pirellulales bacterium]|nr:hypothetical protein [Pirellulales bacterium]